MFLIIKTYRKEGIHIRCVDITHIHKSSDILVDRERWGGYFYVDLE